MFIKNAHWKQSWKQSRTTKENAKKKSGNTKTWWNLSLNLQINMMKTLITIKRNTLQWGSNSQMSINQTTEQTTEWGDNE